MNKYYVYGLFESTNSKLDDCFYIGKGCGYRMYEHSYKSRMGDNPHKDRKINKLKENNKEIVSRKIFNDLNEEEAYILEENLIKQIGLENLTNITKGGEGAPSGKENYLYGIDRSKEKNPMYGLNHTDKSKKKMSESHKGKERSEEIKRKISKSISGPNNHPVYTNKNHKRRKLNENKVAKIKWLSRNSDLTQKEVSKIYSIDQGLVSKIKNNKSWSHVNPLKPKKINNETKE